MAKFTKKDTIADLQNFIQEVYAIPDDRLYSVWDLLTQAQRFTMRALKGIRKNDTHKITNNILIAVSWSMAIANRLHINMEEEVWKRFPYLCSYCGKMPCACKATKLSQRVIVKINNDRRPHSLSSFQKMLADIYPPEKRTLADAGVHFAEEIGEVSEAIHNFLGQHLQKQFNEVKIELADFFANMLGVGNSLNIDLAKEFEKMYYDNCHVCHNIPCTCTFSDVAEITS